MTLYALNDPETVTMATKITHWLPLVVRMLPTKNEPSAPNSLGDIEVYVVARQLKTRCCHGNQSYIFAFPGGKDVAYQKSSP